MRKILLRCLLLSSFGCSETVAPGADAGPEKLDAVVVVHNDAAVTRDDAATHPDAATNPDADTDAAVNPDATPPVSILTVDEQAVFRAASPLPATPPADPTNAYADNAAAAVIGQKWFFDRRFSGPVGAAGQGQITPAPTEPPAAVVTAVGARGTPGLVSCETCHAFTNNAFGDDKKTPNHISLGTGVHPRHTPPIVNSAYNEVTNWGGRFAAQWELPLPVSENPRIMNSSRIYLAQQIFKFYGLEYKALFHEADHGVDGGDALLAAVKLKIAAFNAAQIPVIVGDELAGGTIPRGKPKANAMAADGLWESLSMEEKFFVNRVATNFGKALAAYQRKLIRRDTPFDAWVAAGFVGNAVTASAALGAKVFLKANCDECHKGPMLSDYGFKNTGLRQIVATDLPPTEGVGAAPLDGSDLGRFFDGDALAKANGAAGATPGVSVTTRWSDDPAAGMALLTRFGAVSPMPDTMRGAFRTPSLRQVKETPPYMHAGQLKTLREVVDFYDRGGDADGFLGAKDPLMLPLGLTPTEKDNLVSFLEQLTATSTIPAALTTDTSGQ